jgi:type II secretory pathway pseudopilin PulG
MNTGQVVVLIIAGIALILFVINIFLLVSSRKRQKTIEKAFKESIQAQRDFWTKFK